MFPIIPAIPPNRAIITSQIVGLVRAIISEVAVSSGEIIKYRVEVTRLIITCVPNLPRAFFSIARSRTASEYPIVKIPLIRGEISIAPIITAVELTFRPIEAMRIAIISIHIFVPLITVFSSIISSISS